MPKAMSIKPDPYQHMWTPDGQVRRDLHGLGVPAEGLRRSGVSSRTSGRSTASRSTGARKWSSGTGRPGTRPTSATGAARRRSSASCTTTPIDGVRRALPTARVGGPDTAGSGGQWMRDFLEHQLRGKNFATGQTGTPIDFVSFHAQGPARLRRRPRPHGDLESARDHRRRVPDRRVVSGAEVEADRHRRIRSGRAAPPARARSCSTATRRCIRATRPRASRGSTISPSGMA